MLVSGSRLYIIALTHYVVNLQAPHPLYQPTNDLVVCKDPICASLHPDNYKCDDPDQCDYEVEYADGGSSIGVLVNDLFPVNLTSGMRARPRLTIGLENELITIQIVLEIFYR